MEITCSSCQRSILPEKTMTVDTGKNIYHYCPSCLKSSQNLLSMKLELTKEEKSLLKSIRKFLKSKKN